MARKRNRSDIVVDILTTIQKKGGEIKPTRLMYGANLAHGQMKLYITDLKKQGLVEAIEKKGNEFYVLTEQGYKYIQKIYEMKQFEEAFGI